MIEFRGWVLNERNNRQRRKRSCDKKAKRFPKWKDGKENHNFEDWNDAKNVEKNLNPQLDRRLRHFQKPYVIEMQYKNCISKIERLLFIYFLKYIKYCC